MENGTSLRQHPNAPLTVEGGADDPNSSVRLAGGGVVA